MTNVEASAEEELEAFETGALDPAKFSHPEHVRLGYEMLRRYSFGEAIVRFSRGLKLLAAKVERPDLYHETVTIAFLAVIGERRAQADHDDWENFKANNRDLFDKCCLEKWYGAEQLASDLARRTFCLPQVIGGHTSSSAAGSVAGLTRIARKAPKRSSAALQS